MTNKPTPKLPFLGLLYLFLLSMSQPPSIVLSATPPPEAASEASSSGSDDASGDDAAGFTIMDTGTSAHIVNALGAAYYNPSRPVALAPTVCLKHTSSEVVRKNK
jgi:hypothetical protein